VKPSAVTAPQVGDHLDRRAVERVQDVAGPPGRPVDRVLGRPDHADQPERRPSSAIALIAASTAAAPDMSYFSAVSDSFGFSQSGTCRR
jgi:hypothetical protein